jgi:hypothetical protein
MIGRGEKGLDDPTEETDIVFTLYQDKQAFLHDQSPRRFWT